MNYAIYFGLSFAGAFMALVLFGIVLYWLETFLSEGE